MLRRVVSILAIIAGIWLWRRLWPAIVNEPATWLGDDWLSRLIGRLAAPLISVTESDPDLEPGAEPSEPTT